MVSTCRAQPTAQSSSASVASARAALATWSAISIWPRSRCVRAMATSSRARFRAEIPGRARAWFSAVRDSGNRPAMRAALGQGPVQVDEEVGIDGRGEPALGHPFRLGRVADPVQGLGEPAHQAVVLGRASR